MPAKPRALVTNPFGDESDDDDDEMITNPFGRRQPQTSSQISKSVTNPFDDDDDDDDDNDVDNNFKPAVNSRINTVNNSLPMGNKSSKSATNPFEDDDDDILPSISRINLEDKKQVKSTFRPVSKKQPTNPFGDEPKTESRQAPSVINNGLDKSTNPFDDSHTNNTALQNKVSMKIQQPIKTQNDDDDHHNPFRDDEAVKPLVSNKTSPISKPQVATRSHTTSILPSPTSNINPFDSDEIPAPLVSSTLNNKAKTNEQGPTHTRRSTFFGSVTGWTRKNENNNTNESTTLDAISVDMDTSTTPLMQSKGEGSPPSKPVTLHHRSFTDSAHSGLSSWLRGNKTVDEQEFSNTSNGKQFDSQQTISPQRNGKAKTTTKSMNKTNNVTKKKKIKKPTVQCWPYDDYHKEQEKYYKSLEDSEISLSPIHSSKKSDGAKGGMNPINFSKKTTPNDKSKFDGSNSNKLYERPSELPSIKEAVQNLSLFDFENKAEERAISIVSTWLYDAGLIDELLAGDHAYRSPNARRHFSSVSSVSSVRTSEGIEIGIQGYPIEGGMKIVKEIEKLRSSAQRELTLVNTRLNDGVAASGSEVQELVDAVSATKNDLGRLRELTTYISTGESSREDNKGDNSEGSFSEYPRLKRAINARRNIFRCFRELEFFSNIPSTCDRLREELHQQEWTENEWNTIRNVCMEHVELEILLVEAEAGIKAWLDDEDAGDDDSSLVSFRSNRGLKKSWKTRNSIASDNDEYVDKFLSEHVKNVWELGEEIRMRILAGMESAFELALQNPSGMVALVEAVEVYERAAEEYRILHKDDDQTVSQRNSLKFTGVRSVALAQLYQDFELRGLEVFRTIHMQAADIANEEDAMKSQFNAVLRAATELVSEIDIVKNQMSPCFAPHWHVEMLWSSCVAHVCSNQIIQQIGGPDGQNLPDLTVTQLLDLVAWVEFFRETIEEAFPFISDMHAKKTYFDQRPDLFTGDSKEVNMDNATDSLAWVNNMLWEVHRLAQDEFLLRTRSQTEDWLNNVYKAKREIHQTQENRLMTSLCEDTFTFANIQLRTIRERLTKKSEALVMAVCLIFSQLRSKQMQCRDEFLIDFETCCAAANDFLRMGEKCEDLLQELLDNSNLPDDSIKMLEDSCGTLVSLYSADAVFAAQKTHVYIFTLITDSISDDLFSAKWETDYTHNELAKTLTTTLEDYIGDLENFLDEFMVKKAVDSLVTSSVIFYVKCLLLKAEKHNSNKITYFQNNEVALERMERDVKVIKDYFDTLAEAMPALKKAIEKEFALVTTIQELMRIAAGLSVSDATDFILVLHKRVKDVNVTKHVVGDIWHLVLPTEERTVWELTGSLEETLNAVCPPDEDLIVRDRMNVPGLRIDEILAKMYMESKRKRPVVPGVMENMTANWRHKWNAAPIEE